MTTSTLPALIFMLGGLLIPFFKGKGKSVYMMLIPVAGFLNLIHIPMGEQHLLSFGDFHLVLMNVDRLSLLFGYIFHIISLITVIYILNFKDNTEFVAGFFYAGAALGTIFAGDLFTFFVFWESLTVGSVMLIWSRKTKSAQAAGFRYLLVHAFGGLVLLAGIVFHFSETGSLEMSQITLGSLSSYLIFFGIGINCAWPLVHPWLTDAYPEATIGGTVFLSAFTTKTAVYALARLYPGTELLIWIGVGMAAFPIFYAVIENDLRRVLAYSLINQVGFMVVGIGIGTELAINGACAHAFNDILFKGLLFMSMGAVMYRTGKINATDLGGLYKSMPWTCLFCCVGAASISAFPLFSGFVSKSMVMSAAALGSHVPGQGSLVFVWLVLLFASAGVFHHAGIKIPFFAFFGHDSGLRVKEAPKNMLIAMGMAAFLCIFIGTYPKPLYDILPFPVDYQPYTISHVLTQTELLFFSALAFVLLLLGGIYPAEQRAVNLDSDWIYRKAGRGVYALLSDTLNPLNSWCESLVRAFASGAAGFFKDAFARLALFFSVNFWLARSVRGKRLEFKKGRLYTDMVEGTVPIGIGAAVAVSFILLVFILT
ncbi:Na(+)/H(+) antiporter subunit D [Desulfospira joergensenii]|uniref:Na(+)/H(+) antiporter subunit D n=1 Tax=Desulfospira joergensenii TaxID=53329 RepID=UPI0003B43E61|nr:Na(+)/H(+) antiporter subunit D [Desulfospira joergensenii]